MKRGGQTTLSLSGLMCLVPASCSALAVRDEGDLPAARVLGAVDAGAARLAAQAAQLHGGDVVEAAAVGVVDEEAHDVLFDVQRVVVLALPRLDPALAGGVVKGAVALPAALLAAEVVEARGLLSEGKAVADLGHRAAVARRAAAWLLALAQ